MIKEVTYCRFTDVSDGIIWSAEISENEALFKKSSVNGSFKTQEKKTDIRFIQSLDIFFDLCFPEEWGSYEDTDDADKLFLIRDGREYKISYDTRSDLIKNMFSDLKRYFRCCFEGTARPCELRFDSFDGGGPEYGFRTEKKGVFTWYSSRQYYNADHEKLCGAGYDVVFSLFPMRSGISSAVITGDSPICPTPPQKVYVKVSDDLEVSTVTLPEGLCGAWEEPGVIGTRLEIEGDRLTVLWRSSPVLVTEFKLDNILDDEYDLVLKDNKLRYSESEGPYAEITGIRHTGEGLEFTEYFPISGESSALLKKTDNSRYGNYNVREDLLPQLEGTWREEGRGAEFTIKNSVFKMYGGSTEITLLEPRSAYSNTFKIAAKDPSVHEFGGFFGLEFTGDAIVGRPAILDGPSVTLVFTKRR